MSVSYCLHKIFFLSAPLSAPKRLGTRMWVIQPGHWCLRPVPTLQDMLCFTKTLYLTNIHINRTLVSYRLSNAWQKLIYNFFWNVEQLVCGRNCRESRTKKNKISFSGITVTSTFWRWCGSQCQLEWGSGWPSDPNNGQRPTSLELRRAPHTEANKKISLNAPRCKATSTLTNSKHCAMHFPTLLLLFFLASRSATASSLLGKLVNIH